MLTQYIADSRFFWTRGNATCDIFTCAKNFGDTDPTPGAHPPNVPILADRRARTPRTRSVQLRFQIFLEQLQCNVTHFHVREKKLDPIWLPLIRLFAAIVDFSCFLRRSASKGPCLPRHRRVDRRRFDGERGDERRERLLARHRAASCPSDAAPARPASRGVLSRPASRVGSAPGAHGARATRAHARRV